MPKAKTVKKSADFILKNVLGVDMDPKDYFFSDGTDKEKERPSLVPGYFNDVCGAPVDREDLLEVFNKIFKPEDNFLFYKTRDKEVYVIIPPIKFADTIGVDNDSLSGDHQRHAISFVSEGSVNVDTLKQKLLRVAESLKYSAK